jgi:hypothetical protein
MTCLRKLRCTAHIVNPGSERKAVEQLARSEARQAESYRQKNCGEIGRRSGISGAKINLNALMPESTESLSFISIFFGPHDIVS